MPSTWDSWMNSTGTPVISGPKELVSWVRPASPRRSRMPSMTLLGYGCVKYRFCRNTFFRVCEVVEQRRTTDTSYLPATPHRVPKLSGSSQHAHSRHLELVT